MAPKEIDYSKTCMYRIVCNDLTIKECYVGHTTDFRKRKSRHKSDCINANSKKRYNLKVYQFIRNNGGWENWTMVLIETYPCNTGLEASQRERYWVEKLSATLNSQLPSRTKKQYQEENKELIAKYKQKYYVDNKELILKHRQEYNAKNKECIRSKQNKVSTCECGNSYTNTNKARHEKSAKHVDYMENRLFYTIQRGLDLIKKLDKHFKK